MFWFWNNKRSGILHVHWIDGHTITEYTVTCPSRERTHASSNHTEMQRGQHIIYCQHQAARTDRHALRCSIHAHKAPVWVFPSVITLWPRHFRFHFGCWHVYIFAENTWNCNKYWLGWNVVSISGHHKCCGKLWLRCSVFCAQCERANCCSPVLIASTLWYSTYRKLTAY